MDCVVLYCNDTAFWWQAKILVQPHVSHIPCGPEQDLPAEDLLPDSPNQFPPITSEEIFDSIHNQKEYGAPGHDQIPNVLLRRCSDIVIPLFAGIMNACLRLGTHCATWKCAHVIAVPKSEDHRNRLGKLRPISLIPVIGKVLEKLINERLTHFLEENKKISNRQFWFRRHNSCELAVLHLVNKIEEKLTDGKQSLATSLDVSMAFDTVKHNVLKRRLATLNVPLYIETWCRDGPS